MKQLPRGDAAKDMNAWKAMRFTGVICVIPVLIITATFCGLYWSMWSAAQDADIDTAANHPQFTDEYPYYDTCGQGTLLLALDKDKTGWSVILAFASILYLLLFIFAACVTLSFVVAPFALCGAFG